jgi:hypothetical protein
MIDPETKFISNNLSPEKKEFYETCESIMDMVEDGVISFEEMIDRLHDATVAYRKKRAIKLH